MLSKVESKTIFAYISMWSRLGIIPFPIDAKEGKLLEPSKRKMLVWRMFFAFSVLHMLHGMVHCIITFANGMNSVPNHVAVLQIALLYIPAVYLTISYRTEVVNGDLLRQIFNELYDADEKSVKWRPLKQWRIDELASTYYPILGATYTLYCDPLIYIAEPNLPHMIINNPLLMRYKDNWLIFGLTVYMEVWASSMWLINYFFVLTIYSLVCNKLITQVQRASKRLERWDGSSFGTLQKIYQNCRKNQLLTILFNQVNSTIMCGTKFLYIAFAIQCAFLAIRHFGANVALGLFFSFCIPNVVGMYAIIFGTAYQVPVRTAQLHHTLRFLSKDLGNRGEARLLIRQVRSLRGVGIKVGGFSVVERDSPLVFVSFVIDQVVGLLVTFP